MRSLDAGGHRCRHVKAALALAATFALALPARALAASNTPKALEEAPSPQRTESTHELSDTPAPVEPRHVAGDEVQRMSYVESAYGASTGIVFGGAVSQVDSNAPKNAQAGMLFGGSPLRRLTLTALLGRDEKARFAPSLAAQFLAWGGGQEPHALGVFAQYKAEGFTEAGGEVELGPLYSFRPGRFRLDAAALFGIGLEEEAAKGGGEERGEADVEGKLRIGYQVLAPLRIGLLGRFRSRVSGERSLAGGKTWDFIGGGELVTSFGPFAIAASGGPTTVNVASGVAAYGMLSLALMTKL